MLPHWMPLYKLQPEFHIQIWLYQNSHSKKKSFHGRYYLLPTVPGSYRHGLTSHSPFNSRRCHPTHKPHPGTPTRQQSHGVTHNSSNLKAGSESGEQRAVKTQRRIQSAYQRAQIHHGSRCGSRDEFTWSAEDRRSDERKHGAERPQQSELTRLQQE